MDTEIRQDNPVTKPVTFETFNLSSDIARAIEKLGFKEPTEVQIRTYGEVMSGRDVIAMAQTGTGKTAAFGIPIAQKIETVEKHVHSLVLTPTRELALQVCRELTAIGELKGVRCAAVYGGASFTKQVTEVGDGAQVVAGTPGRVLDHIRRGTISFDDLEILVLDEADEMLSMGFEKEISEIIESLPKKRQTLLFSATIPDDIRRLSGRYMGEATVISVSGDNIAAKEVSHFVYLVTGQGRPKDMIRVLEAERPNSALVFCNTRDETQTLARYLKKNGYNAEWLNSDLSQNERESVMRRTRAGKIQFLVATDVAARGIDVSHLSHVINYSFPESLEVYVHRTGRTGRMGRQGAAVSLVTPQDIGNLYYLRLTYKIHPVEKTLENDRSAAKTVELDRLTQLRQAYAKKLDNGFLELARRLMQDVRGERIVAGLLANHFEAKPPASVPQKQEKAAATDHEERASNQERSVPRKKTQPPQKETRAKKEPAEREPAKKEDAKKAPAKKFKTEESRHFVSKPENTETEIYIDAGRKDGLRISFLMKEIARLTDLPRTALGKVRLLTRSTFVAVPKEHFKTVIEAISRIDLDGRRLKAEPAKQS